jgi:hypothetical protein
MDEYKKYSLEKLEEWMHDALSCSEATPQEIYDVIKKVVEENYYNYKYHTGRCYELLALLNGNGIGHIQAYDEYVTDPKGNQVKVCDKDDPSPECKGAWDDFWEQYYYPEEYSQYTEDELNAMCDKAASDQEKEKCREYNLREAEYYNKRVELDANAKKHSYSEMIAAGWEMTADGFWIKESTSEKEKKQWCLPVKVDGLTGECYINFPDDLLEAANLKEGDTVEWIDNGNGSFTMRKVNGTGKNS